MSQFKEGDRVFHQSRRELGTVIKVTKDGTVHVQFPKGKCDLGIFDKNWFLTNGTLLLRAEFATEPTENDGDTGSNISLENT